MLIQFYWTVCIYNRHINIGIPLYYIDCRLFIFNGNICIVTLSRNRFWMAIAWNAEPDRFPHIYLITILLLNLWFYALRATRTYFILLFNLFKSWYSLPPSTNFDKLLYTYGRTTLHVLILCIVWKLFNYYNATDMYVYNMGMIIVVFNTATRGV